MHPDMFLPSSPGTLVPTTAWERRSSGRTVEAFETAGLAFVPNDLPPDLDWRRLYGELTIPLLEAHASVTRLDGKASRLENPHLLLQPFLRREARLSSKIEDTIASPSEIALVAAGGDSDRGDPREVFNYVEALEFGLRSPLPLCNRLLCEMHGILLGGVRGDHAKAGEFRKVQNWIGREALGFKKARFVPPPPGGVLTTCMGELEKFLNRSPDGMPPLVAIALAHYQFETIHPYEDGNGRLGRLLIALSMCRSGLLANPYIYVSAYFEQHEQEYKDLLLAVSRDGRWEDWIAFFLDAIATQAKDADLRVDRLLELWRSYAQLVTGKRTTSLLRHVIDELFRSPAISVPRLKEMLGVSDTAARNHVGALVDFGVLSPGPQRGRLQWYIAEGILDVAEGDLTATSSDRPISF